METAAYLIAGLGNPGNEYAATRHNAGFLLAERLARHWQVVLRPEPWFSALLGRFTAGGRSGWLCQPQTYMNASGLAVAALARYYRLPPERVLVLVDDADLPLGTLRLRPEGSSGGHHGLESVERELGTRAYPRLRLGIGRRTPVEREITGHVLGKFTREEWRVFEAVLDRGVRAVECWLTDGVRAAMNRFNGTVAVPEQRQTE